MWICPHCRMPLMASPDGASLACINGHAFDRAREGYVNLLPANRKRKRDPGDNAQMVAARRRVHGADAYRPLADAVVSELAGLQVAGPLLELGCGEGYYCSALSDALPACPVYGLDISRSGVRLAARGCRSANFAVASTFQLPLPDASIEAAVRIFAPSDDAEVRRVLAAGRHYLEVSPAPRHLWQLREQLYDTPREHAPARVEINGMQLLESRDLCYELTVDSVLLADILSMTPFAHRGHRARRDRLQAATIPALSMAFSMHLFQKVG